MSIDKRLIQNRSKIVISNMYEENGFKDREECVKSLSEDLDVSETIINNVIDKIGEEDIDKIVTYVQDNILK